jgi:ATP-binding cassette subfamily B protein
MTRDIERGTRGVHSLISMSLYSIVPTIIELTLVLTVLGVKFDSGFVWITLAALVVYIGFTVTVTEWRTQFRRTMNELDSKAQSHAVDSLLNYETVKYSNNRFEAGRYDASLERYRKARQEPDHAEPAQCGAAVPDRGQPGRDALPRYARRGRRAHDAG